ERLTLELREEIIQLIERLRLRPAAVRQSAEAYAAPLGVNDSVPWLLQLGALLETSPGPPTSWLTALDLPELAADLERCAALYQRYWQTHRELTDRYGQRMWDLPPGTATAVEQACQGVLSLL